VIAKAGGRVVGTATDTGHIDLVDDTVPLLAAALADQCELVASRSN
jgi:hypothetical protein